MNIHLAMYIFFLIYVHWGNDTLWATFGYKLTRAFGEKERMPEIANTKVKIIELNNDQYK